MARLALFAALVFPLLVLAEPDGGAPVWTMLSVDGTIVEALEDPAGLRNFDADPRGPVADGGVVLGDSKRPPFDADGVLRRHPRADFRSPEGWGPLRWGMTAAEVKKAVPSAKKTKQSAGRLAIFAWATKVDGSDARAVAFLVEDHLAAVKITIDLGIDFDHVEAILRAKYEEPYNTGVLEAAWERPQTTIDLYVERLRPTVWFASRVHAHELRTELRAQDAKAEGL